MKISSVIQAFDLLKVEFQDRYVFSIEINKLEPSTSTITFIARSGITGCFYLKVIIYENNDNSFTSNELELSDVDFITIFTKIRTMIQENSKIKPLKLVVNNSK